MSCPICAHGKQPDAHRTASVPPSQVCFGDEIHVDCVQVYDSSGKGHWSLSIVAIGPRRFTNWAI